MPDISAQSIFIRQRKTQDEPSPHVVYKIEINLQSRSWSVWHRYTDFVDLHSDLAREVGGIPPFDLPPKRSWTSSWLRVKEDQAFFNERQAGLERYLRVLLSHKDERWRTAYTFTNFISAPSNKASHLTGSETEFTVSSWLVEQEDLHSIARSIRSNLNRRDALAVRGDSTASHLANVDAKKQLVGLISRLTILAKGLDDLGKGGLPDGELRRRADMVTRLQDETETLGKLAIASRNEPFASRTFQSTSPTAARTELLGSAAAQSTSKPGRVLGAKNQPVETAQTRPLDNASLLLLQQEQISSQDSRLESLTTVLRRQRQLGAAIGQELDLHNQLLDDLTTNVDQTGSKLSGTKAQLKRLDGS